MQQSSHIKSEGLVFVNVKLADYWILNIQIHKTHGAIYLCGVLAKQLSERIWSTFVAAIRRFSCINQHKIHITGIPSPSNSQR